jgi:uncharacterized membrane protein
MSIRQLPTLVFAALVAWFAGELTVLWPRLPERIAIHFDFAGLPNGWSTREQLMVLMTVQFAVFGALLGSAQWLERLPDRLISLPNKAYWLAPERRAATLAAVGDGMRWLLLATMTFVAIVMIAALKANLSSPPHLAIHSWVLLATPLALSLAMVGWLYRRFRP